MARENLTPREQFSDGYVREVPRELELIEGASQRHGLEGIQLGRTEGALLSFLVALLAPRVVVEIGGLYGASASWILSALPAGGRLITLEKEPDRAALLSSHLKEQVASGRLQVLVGDARTELEKIPEDLDVGLVFIDANKSAYPDYLAWAERRLSAGGLLIADNTLLFGSMLEETPESVPPAMWKAMRKFNDHLKSSSAWSSVLLPTTEGFTLARRL